MPTSRSPRRSRPADSRTRPTSPSRWIPSDLCETPEGAAKALGGLDGIVVPGGFGIRGIEGKLGALKFAREQGIPTLGLCLGPAVHGDRVRPARRRHRGRVLERVRPRHRRTRSSRRWPSRSTIIAGGDLGGTMRLGMYPAELAEGSLAARAVRRVARRRAPPPPLRGQQRATATRSPSAGLFFSGLSPDRNLVEYVELPREVHPYYIATQAHPELRSRPTDPHPLFRGLVGAALERHRSSELFDVDEWLTLRGRARRASAARRARRRRGPRQRPRLRRARLGRAQRHRPLRRRRDRAPVRRSPRRRGDRRGRRGGAACC